MKAVTQISDAELEVMKVLWQLGRATSADIVEQLTTVTEWKPKTVQTLITRLLAKGAISADTKEARAYIYSPLVSESEYKEYANHTFLEKLYNGSVKMMLASFIREQKMSKEELESLRNLLEEE